jgi:diacylglycerol kinase family enzyme
MARTLIVNPRASRVTAERIAQVETRLRPVETLLTARPGHAVELARDAAGDEVWALGGDGLVNEVLNGLRPDVALGVVPAGHTNVLARALGGPRRISVGRVNGRRFAFAAGIGVDSEAVRELDTIRRQQSGRRPGDLDYARFVAARLLRGFEPALEVAGHGRASLAFVSNGPIFTYAGRLPIRISPQARFELGLDLAAPLCVHPRDLAAFVPRLAIGHGVAGGHGVIRIHDSDRIELRCDRPLALQADGEDLGDVTEAVFEAERAAVTVLPG